MTVHDPFDLTTLNTLFHQNSHSENSVRMAQYMKNHFEFFGIKSPLRKELQRQWFQKEFCQTPLNFINLIDALWQQDKREFQYVALDIGKRYKKLFLPEHIPTIQYWIETKSWWDTVDALASHFIGGTVYNYPELKQLMDEWIDHNNMWIRRTALLHQLNFKSKTDSDRLFMYCEKRMHETEFFIRKAIGWALRQYSYVDADGVIDFVKQHESQLSTLSKTEALKALKREGMV